MKMPSMTYFEAKKRLENLEKFRELYSEYTEFTNRESNRPAKIHLSKMEPLKDIVSDSLRQVDLGMITAREAPSRGGKKMKINLIRAIFRNHIIRHFMIDDDATMAVIDKGIARYQVFVWREKIQLFNPFYWLYHFGEFIARIPILLANKAGVDTSETERSQLYKAYTIIIQIMLIFLVAYAVGAVDWIAEKLIS